MRHFRHEREVLLEVFGADSRQDVDFEHLVQQSDPGFHGEIVIESGVDLEKRGHEGSRLLGREVAEVDVEIGKGEQVFWSDMVQVSPLNFKHLYQLIVLLKQLTNSRQSLLIAARAEPPPEVNIFA